MARVKLDIPRGNPVFSTEMPIRVTDLNYGNHLGNDAVLGLVHEARVRMLRSFGYSEMDIGGCGIIMADAMIVYKNEGLYGYDLQVQIYTGEVSRLSFELYYLITTGTGKPGMEIARVKTGIVCFDYRQRRIVPVPEDFKISVLDFRQSC